LDEKFSWIPVQIESLIGPFSKLWLLFQSGWLIAWTEK